MQRLFPGKLVFLIGWLVVALGAWPVTLSLSVLLERQSAQVSELFPSSALNASGCPCSLPYGSLQVYDIEAENESRNVGTSWTFLSDRSFVYAPSSQNESDVTNVTLLLAPEFSGSLIIDADPVAVGQWEDYTATVTVNASAGNDNAGLLVRVRDASDFYLLKWANAEQAVSFERLRPGFLHNTLAMANGSSVAAVNQSDTITLTVTALGRQFQVSVNDWSPWSILVDSSEDAILGGSTGLFASGNAWLSFQNWTVDGAVQVAATPVPPLQDLSPVPSPVGVQAPVTPLNDTAGVRLAYTIYFPLMSLSEFTSTIDVVIRAALDTRLSFQTTWLVGKRSGSVYADYYSLVADSSPYAQANGTAFASSQLRSYVCHGGLTFDTGVNATCPNGSIAVTRIVPSLPSSSSPGSSAGLIGGVVVSVILSLVALAAILYYLYRRQRKRKLAKARRMQIEQDEEREQAKSSTLSITALSSACGVALENNSSASHVNLYLELEAPTKPSTPSIREALRAFLLANMLGKQRPRHGRWDALVLDARCTQILSAVCRFSELNAHGINTVESLEQVAQLKHFSTRTNTIFLVTGDEPSLAHVAQVCASLSPRASSPTKSSMSQRRFDMLLLSIRPIASPLLDVVRSSLSSAHASLHVHELCADVLALDDCTFSLELPELFGTFYGRQTASTSALPLRPETNTLLKRECAHVGIQLASCLRILGLGMPKIEIHTTHVASNVAMGIADAVRSALAGDRLSTPGQTQNMAAARMPTNSQRNCNIRLVLVDRAADPLTPIRHDLTYDAFLHDVLASLDDHNAGLLVKLPGHVLTNGSIGGSPLSYGTADDPTWLRLRYLRIHEAAKSAHAELDRFLAGSMTSNPYVDHEAAAAAAGLATRQRLPNAPSNESITAYHQVVERLSFHLEQLEKCTALFQSRYIASIMDVESMLISGKDPSTGKRIRRTDQQQRVEALLNHPSVEPSAKLRLLLLWVACRGADASLLVRWIAKAQIDDRGRCALRAYIECLRAERHSTEPIKRQWRARDGAPLLIEVLSRCAAAASGVENGETTGTMVGSSSPLPSHATSGRSAEPGRPGTASSDAYRLRTVVEEATVTLPPVSPDASLSASHTRMSKELASPIESCVMDSTRQSSAKSSTSTRERGLHRTVDGRSSCQAVERTPANTVLVVFFIGGLSHTECHLADAFAKQSPNLDLYIGGTHLTTPSAFLRDLGGLFLDAKEEAL
jgi:cbb3-type cytochrome oxidase subunit 3